MKYAFLCLFYLLSCTREPATPVKRISAPEGYHVMIKTGLPEIEQANQLNFSAKKYKVYFHNIGCRPDRSQMDSINNLNDSVMSIVSASFGKNWFRKLRLELDTLDKVRSIAYEEMLKRDIHHSDHYYYLVCPGLQKNKYLVRVYTWAFGNDNAPMNVKYHLEVDSKKKSVIFFSKAPVAGN